MSGKHLIPVRRFFNLGIKSICLAGVFWYFTLLVPPVFALDRNEISRQIENRLKEIFDTQTQEFFNHLVMQDQYLDLTIQRLNREIKVRKDEGGSIDVSEFNLIFGVDPNLIKRYSEELANIIHMIDELNELERTSQSLGDATTAARIDQLKERLKSALEVSDADRPNSYSGRVTDKLLSDYDKELERLVATVREFQRLKMRTDYLPKYQTQVEQLEKEIANILKLDQNAPQALVKNYIDELTKVVDILRQLDELEKQMAPGDLENHLLVRKIKDRVFQSVDKKMLAALGYSYATNDDEQKQLEAYFDNWKAKQILWFRAKAKQVEILKNRLITTGTTAQNRRLFEADVLQAVEVYNQANFELAGLLFQDLLHYYSYKNMDDFRYYLAECYLMQKQYARAQDLYLTIVENNLDLPNIKQSYWRLMLISDSFNRYRDFFQYAEAIFKIYKSQPSDDFLEQVIFYTGYMAYWMQNFNKSLELLSQLTEKSSFYLPSQFIVAVNYLNMNRPEKALPILTMLSKDKTYPEKDERAVALQNQALLKIGLIYYNQNELLNALQTLEKVNPETPGYDVVLLSRAWTKFRLGHLQDAANDLDLLFWQHLSSNYVYEGMMLSAHCNRLLGNVKSSIRKVRYVDNAEKTRQINDEMNQERQKINHIMQELDYLEEKVIATNDPYTYQTILELRNDLQLALQSLAYKGDPGLQLIQEQEEEQQHLENLIRDYQDLNKVANALGKSDLERAVNHTTHKLEAKLIDLQKFQNASRVDILADYPLARKESNLHFQQQKLNTMRTEADSEQQKLEEFKEEVAKLLTEARQKQDRTTMDQLEYRNLEMTDLENRLEAFMVFISHSKVNPPETDYRKWSDFSGFGISDLDFVWMKSLDQQREIYHNHALLINTALKQKEEKLLRDLALLDGKITVLEQSMQTKKIADLKSKREKYFSEDYFVNKTSELQMDGDQELKILLEDQSPSVPIDSTKVEKY